MKRLTLSMLALALIATATSAQAQERKGFWFTGGLGYGSLGCDNCGSRTGSWSGGLALGGTVSPHFQIGVGMAGWSKSDLGATLTVGTLDARVKFYPSKGGFYLTGGAGAGSVSAGFGGLSGSETGVSMLLGLGYDIPMGKLAITPYWNGFAVRTSNTTPNVGQLGIAISVP